MVANRRPCHPGQVDRFELNQARRRIGEPQELVSLHLRSDSTLGTAGDHLRVHPPQRRDVGTTLDNRIPHHQPVDREPARTGQCRQRSAQPDTDDRDLLHSGTRPQLGRRLGDVVQPPFDGGFRAAPRGVAGPEVVEAQDVEAVDGEEAGNLSQGPMRAHVLPAKWGAQQGGAILHQPAGRGVMHSEERLIHRTEEEGRGGNRVGGGRPRPGPSLGRTVSRRRLG